MLTPLSAGSLRSQRSLSVNIESDRQRSTRDRIEPFGDLLLSFLGHYICRLTTVLG